MYEPSQFQVNETWILFKLNDVPVSTSEDGDFNVFALMDAASCYILSTEFVSTNLTEPSKLESNRLLEAGYSHKDEYPKMIFIPTNQSASILSKEADLLDIAVVRIPEDELSVYLDYARQALQEYLSEEIINET